MLVFGILLTLIVVLVLAAAYSDYHWRRRGFKTVVTGRGADRVKTRVRIDPDAQLPEDTTVLDQDWVRQHDFDEPDPEEH